MNFGKAIRDQWLLDENIIFLNNGSFGACPIEVMEASAQWQKRAEKEPMIFFVDEYFHIIRNTAARFGKFLGCSRDSLVFVENATTGINTVLFSLLGKLKAGDEILTTSHVYPAVRNAMKHYAGLAGCKYVEAKIPFPVNSEEEIIDSISSYISESTKLAVIDHVSSATGIIFPVEKIVGLFREKNILIAIDGAHAPGMIDLDIEHIDADWYTGNLHKWLFAPKGAAVLHSKECHHNYTKPLTISLFYGNGFTNEFDWTGTKSQISVLSANEALDFFMRLDGDSIRLYQKELLIQARNLICDRLEIEKPVPDSMLAAMSTIEFPFITEQSYQKSLDLRQYLLRNYDIELFTTFFDNRIMFRISCQIYNYLEEYEKLAFALQDIKERKLLG